MISTDYQPQSLDTCIEAELIQFKLWREMSDSQKLNLVRRIYHRGSQLILIGIRHQYSHLSTSQLKQLYLKKRWGTLIEKTEKMIDCRGELMLEDPLWLIQQLSRTFDSLNIPYYVSGSVASSLQGEVRFTEDLDLAIDLQPQQGELLIEALSPDFYISEIAVNEAIQGITDSFNIIHLQTVEKADLFISGQDEFSISKMMRRQLYNLEDNQDAFYVSSPEDTILQKLICFKLSQDQSQKQWRDILGVLKLQSERLDFAYLALWGEQLSLINRLKQAMIQSGLSTDLLD